LEAFIEDAQGTKLFIGTYVSPAKKYIIRALSGPGVAISRTSLNLKIATDKDGNFEGIYTKDKDGHNIIMNPAAYNARICRKRKHLNMKSRFLILIAGLVCCFMACNDSLPCEKHYLKKGFTGKVTIYFDWKNGQHQLDSNGCIVYDISEKGECMSAFPFKEGNRFLKGVFKCFEITNKGNQLEIPIFLKDQYLQDTLKGKQKKYVFFTASGYQNPDGLHPNYLLEYYVDYGVNYIHY
jgi:hypothetical protein